jgi:heme-degrading monooxygenase HmoA
MISAAGCLGERLLVSADKDGELISYSEWRSHSDVDTYVSSEAHEKIKAHTSRIAAESTHETKLYEVAG